MPEAFAAALSYDGLTWLVMGAALAGFVRGFSGFGTALIYLPIAAQVMPPLWTIITLVVMDIVGPLPNLRRALSDGAPRDVARLWAGMVLALPFGLLVLYAVEPWVFRYAVSILALTVPVLLIAGFRYRGPMTPPVMFGTGALSGFLGGAAGTPGPPVILLYMASESPPRLIRGNIMVFLFVFDLTLLIGLGLFGQLALMPVVLGLILIVPNLLGNLAGGAIFNPDKQRLYRAAGYVIVIGSALRGLPLWG